MNPGTRTAGFAPSMLTGVLTACLALIAAPATAQDFYAGKTMTLIVGYGAGSNYDTNARWLARHMKAQIPGTPNIIVQNMPGAGTLTAANNVYNIAPKDGTVIAQVARGMALEPLYGGQGVRYDPLKINWIGSTSREVSVLAVRTDTGVKSIEDAKTKQINLAGTGPGTDGVVYPTALNNMLGTKFKLVTGYNSGKEMALAVERKEVDGRGSWSWASFKKEGMDMVNRGDLGIILQFATEKSPDLPNVPLITEYAKSDEQKQILDLLLAGQTMAWPYMAAAEVPADRLKILRTAFLATMKNPEAVAEADKQQIDLDPVTAEEIETLLKRLYSLPKPIVQQVRELAGRS